MAPVRLHKDNEDAASARLSEDGQAQDVVIFPRVAMHEPLEQLWRF
jgi:hypothetical protein